MAGSSTLRRAQAAGNVSVVERVGPPPTIAIGIRCRASTQQPAHRSSGDLFADVFDKLVGAESTNGSLVPVKPAESRTDQWVCGRFTAFARPTFATMVQTLCCPAINMGSAEQNCHAPLEGELERTASSVVA